MFGDRPPSSGLEAGCSLTCFRASSGDLLNVFLILPNVPVRGESRVCNVGHLGPDLDTHASYNSTPCGD